MILDGLPRRHTDKTARYKDGEKSCADLSHIYNRFWLSKKTTFPVQTITLSIARNAFTAIGQHEASFSNFVQKLPNNLQAVNDDNMVPFVNVCILIQVNNMSSFKSLAVNSRVTHYCDKSFEKMRTK